MIPLYAYWQTFLQATFCTYALWYGASLAASPFFPYGLLPGALLILGVHWARVPQPAAARVEKIIGRDLHVPQAADNNNLLMRTVAHRGAGLDAPENSLIAFKQCANEKCMFIEFDVSLTKDGVAVVFHDSTLERMSNDKRQVNDVDYKELKSIDISVNHAFSDRFKGELIPTLDATVKQLLADKQRMFIDIKDNDSRMIAIIGSLFKTYPELYDTALVTSFFPNIIYGIRKNNPSIVCSLAYRPHFFSHTSYSFLTGVGPRRSSSLFRHYSLCLLDALHSWLLPRITWQLLGLSVILLHKDAVSPQVVKNWRDKGVRPCIWTINQPIDKQYVTRTLKCTYLTDTLVGENSVQFTPEI